MENHSGKATRISLFDLKSVQMRAFHMTWFVFHLCFFGWFGLAPLMAVVREDLDLTKTQIGNTIIASVSITILARVIVGPLCDHFGPRRTYAWLMVLGSLPIMLIGLADSYETFLVGRLAIGIIGASFVITQYHTSVMFAPNIVGAANATTAGWGNLGGGMSQVIMPLIYAAIVGLGFSTSAGWRLSMIVPGIILFIAGIAYYHLTRDTPSGDDHPRRSLDRRSGGGGVAETWHGFRQAASDYRVWALSLGYAGCFGVELTINNIAAIYYFDHFGLDLKTAGIVAGSFGLMNLFARTLGGVGSDFCARHHGLPGRVNYLFITLLCGGVVLVSFSQMDQLAPAIGVMLVFSLFVQMAEGATFGVVPFVNRKALGSVAGIVGAGGNAGAVAAGFLFRSEDLSYQEGLFYLGLAVVLCSLCILAIRFSPEVLAGEGQSLHDALKVNGHRTSANEPSSV